VTKNSAVELYESRTPGRSRLRASPLTVGTMAFGDAGRGSDDTTSKDVIARFLDAGGNEQVDASLRRLGVDYIDTQINGVGSTSYRRQV